MRRVFQMVSILVVLFLIPGITAAAMIELELVSWDDPPGQEIVRQALDEFESLYPNIKVSNRQMPNYKDSLIVQLLTNTAPDVYVVGDWDYPEFWWQGFTANLNPYIEEFGIDKTQWIPTILASHTINGNIHVLPKDFSTIATLYNADHLNGAGLAYPDPDWNWQEALHMAKKLTIVDPATQQIERYGISAPPTDAILAWSFANAAGVPIMDENMSTFIGHLDHPKAIEAMQFAVDLIVKEQVAPGPAQGWDVDLFVNQKLSMVLWGPWYMSDWKETHKDLDFRSVQAPYYGPGRTTALMQAGWAINPSIKDPTRAEAAAKLVLFLSGPRGQYYMARWALPSTPETAFELGIHEDPYFLPFFDAAYDAYLPYWIYVPEFGNILSGRWASIVNSAIRGEKPLAVGIEEIIGPAEAALQEVRDYYNMD
ncbi:MAG: extracellular solute-binding protein [Limnochordia bacterium]|jgi:multiple sugar transport system substrate-binding protein